MTDGVDPAAIIAKGTRWVRAEDGRIVEYSVTGSTRADARTVVAGYFAVTEEPASWTEAYGSLNVRMINVSLPGLGMSSLHPGRLRRPLAEYMMARDVALDLPGLDPRNVTLSGDRVVVWYAADDEDCPPSHGKWLAEHFGARTRVFEGYGHLGGALIDHPTFLRELTD